jgi:hypothetical protein
MPCKTRDKGKQLHDLSPTLVVIDSPMILKHVSAVANGDATILVGCSQLDRLRTQSRC